MPVGPTGRSGKTCARLAIETSAHCSESRLTGSPSPEGQPAGCLDPTLGRCCPHPFDVDAGSRNVALDAGGRYPDVGHSQAGRAGGIREPRIIERARDAPRDLQRAVAGWKRGEPCREQADVEVSGETEVERGRGPGEDDRAVERHAVFSRDGHDRAHANRIPVEEGAALEAVNPDARVLGLSSVSPPCTVIGPSRRRDAPPVASRETSRTMRWPRPSGSITSMSAWRSATRPAAKTGTRKGLASLPDCRGRRHVDDKRQTIRLDPLDFGRARERAPIQSHPQMARAEDRCPIRARPGDPEVLDRRRQPEHVELQSGGGERQPGGRAEPRHQLREHERAHRGRVRQDHQQSGACAQHQEAPGPSEQALCHIYRLSCAATASAAFFTASGSPR